MGESKGYKGEGREGSSEWSRETGREQTTCAFLAINKLALPSVCWHCTAHFVCKVLFA